MSLRRWCVATGLLLLAGGAALLFWPLDANGLGGNAFHPRYTEFGFSSYAPLSLHPTNAELRHAGVRLPQDVVRSRRWHVAAVAVLGAASIAIAGAVGRRPGSRRGPAH